MHTPVLVSHLTVMESVVVAPVLLGVANKCIAGDLTLSQRTIEAHRANLFHKMRVRNAIELGQRLSEYKDVKGQLRHRGPVWFASSLMLSISG